MSLYLLSIYQSKTTLALEADYLLTWPLPYPELASETLSCVKALFLCAPVISAYKLDPDSKGLFDKVRPSWNDPMQRLTDLEPSICEILDL